MRAYFSEGMIQAAIQPLLAIETFTAGPAAAGANLSLPAAIPEEVPAP
jgi:hypothetical protein